MPEQAEAGRAAARDPQHALITGGAGFIGSHLADALLQRGDRVTVVDDLSTGSLDNLAQLAEHPDLEVVIDDVANVDVMDRLVSRSDIVYHMAAVVGVRLVVDEPARVIESNVLGTHAVLTLARRHGTKVVLASTSEIYGKNAKLPFSEDDDRLMGPTTIARWGYAESKAIDEFMALAYHREHGVPVVISSLLQHRRPAPDRALRHGRPPLRAAGTRRGEPHGLRRRPPVALLLQRRGRRARRPGAG